MFRENQVIFMCALLVVAALPMIMLRDLISNTELNYLAVAIDANAHHRLFTFYEDGRPFTELPPLYLLLCRLSRVFGHYGVTCLLALNLACMVGIMYFCDRSYAPMLRGTGPRQKAIVALTASPFIVIMVILVQPEMISLLILTVLIYLLIRRTETLLLHPEREVTTGNVAIPVLLCTEVMTNGLYVILIVPLSVLFVLLVKRRLSLFLRILPPAYAMWFGLFLVFMYALILAEGGWEYCTAVLTKPLERLSYEAWHPLNIMKTIGMVVLLSLPMGICSVYTSIRIMRRNGRQTEVRTLYSILTPLACLIIFVLPGTKVYLFILYALPTLHYQMMYYLQMRHVGNRDLGVKICLMLGLVPFVTVLVLYYALRQRFPVMLDNNIEICALVLLTLVACKAAYKVYTSSAVNALCTFSVGVLAILFVAGFAMPQANPYLSTVPLLEKIRADSVHTGVNKVCMASVPMTWSLNTVFSDLDIYSVEPTALTRGVCLGAYRVAGHRALRYHKALQSWQDAPMVQHIGRMLMLDPGLPVPGILPQGMGTALKSL